ncbi:alpha/beta hydrolase [Streptococcus sp. 2A/TPW/M5]
MGYSCQGDDGSVTTMFSQSFGYLFKGHVKSYQEKEITGPDGQHSKLHETALVDEPMIAFLWGK